jgi:glycosyltransferase involved in cell wall biosynthesis
VSAHPDVVHVVPYYPPHPGGMERVAERLVTTQRALGIPAQVLTAAGGVRGRTPQGDAPFVRRLRSVEMAHTPVIPGLLPALWRTPAGAVVHVHVAHAFIPDLAVAVARHRGQPVLAHYHLDVDPTGPVGALLLRPYQRTLLRRTLHRCAAVVVPTPDYIGVVGTLYGIPPTRVRVIPNGTDFEVLREPRTPPQGHWRLISVGRLSPQKQFPLLFAACARLREIRPDLSWSLDVYGEGELRGELEREIDRRRLRGIVTLHRGDLGREELCARYDAAHLFVLATRKESFGIVFAEAMARGLPVVTTNAPGVRNVVRDGVTGRLAPPEPLALAETMARTIQDTDAYGRMSCAGLTAAADYSWRRVASQFIGLYRGMTSGAPSSAPGRRECPPRGTAPGSGSGTPG